MADSKDWSCQTCGAAEFTDDDDGFRYCAQCGSKSEDFHETGVADEDFIATAGDGNAALYSAVHIRHRRYDPALSPKPEPISQSQFWTALTLDDGDDEDGEPRTPAAVRAETDDGVGPTGPEDFGWIGKASPSFDDYHNEVRIRYVMGLQLMVEFQCEALVRDFKVSPLICGLAGTVWLRFIAATRVFDDGWVDEAINESESQQIEEPPEHFKPRYKYSAEPHNMYGQRAVMIWLRSLKKTIPVSCTLAVSFLACHLAREAVLSTDIEMVGRRPDNSVTAQKLESSAASIAETIGLALPPVNFYAIASRYLRKLCIPLDEILPHALRIYEWSMPSELWLSSNEMRLPTRVCVMSILIVAIRIRYNIHGFGAWEKSFSRDQNSPPKSKGTEETEVKHDPDMEYDTRNGSHHDPDDLGRSPVRNTPISEKPELDTAQLLRDLEARYNDIVEKHEYSKDLPTYLQFCKDVVFAGLEPSFEDHEERKLIDELWNIYQSDKDSKAVIPQEEAQSKALMQKRARTDEGCTSFTPKEENQMFTDNGRVNDTSSIDRNNDLSDDSSQDDETLEPDDKDSTDALGEETPKTLKDEAIRQLKLDMEENRFCYIPPRVKLRRLDYLHYVRKRGDGVLTFVAHADYYILLRACAKVAEIEIRLMHMGVLCFERRLDWIEQRIDRCLHLKLPWFSCEFCCAGSASVESLGLSDLNI